MDTTHTFMRDLTVTEDKMLALLTVLRALREYYGGEQPSEQYALVSVILWQLEQIQEELSEAIGKAEQWEIYNWQNLHETE